MLQLSGPPLWADAHSPPAAPPFSSQFFEAYGIEAYLPRFFHDMEKNKEIRKHVVEDIELHTTNDSVPVRIHPRTISITILGPSVEGQLRKNITAYIDNAHLPAGVYVRPAKIRLPEGYVLVAAHPEIFVLEIKPEKISN